MRRRHLAGEALLAIGRATCLARGTVRKYACAESFPERAVRRPGRSILDPFIAYLEARMAEGCEDAMALWREVQGQGYAHGSKVVQRWVAENRTRPACRTPRKWLQGAPASAAPDAASGPGAALPSPKQLAWLLVRPATGWPTTIPPAPVKPRQREYHTLPHGPQLADLGVQPGQLRLPGRLHRP